MMRAIRYNLGQIALLLFDFLPTPVVITEGYRSLRKRLSRNPERYREKALAVPFTRGSWRERKLAGPETDLVVDGFPGSANSFTSNVVRAAVERPARIESHFHYTAQLRRARHFGVPTVVVIRAPRAACDSMKSKVPISWDWLIVLRWIHYHRFLERHGAGIHLSTFERVTRDIDSLRRQVPAIDALVSGPLQADLEFRRKGKRRTPIDTDRRLVRWLLPRAEALHARLIGTAVEDERAADPREIGAPSPETEAGDAR